VFASMTRYPAGAAHVAGCHRSLMEAPRDGGVARRGKRPPHGEEIPLHVARGLLIPLIVFARHRRAAVVGA
jgi:hypothetical protein